MWKWCQFYCILLYTSVLATEKKTVLDSPLNIMLLRSLRNWSFDAFGRTGMEEKYLQMARRANKVQKTIPNYVPFPCNVTDSRSPEVPESVHKLRPGDIDVIAAMGDSLTAGAGIFADSVLQVVIENRGVTAAGGGQGTWREYLTLPNIIKEFNPNLIGFALGDSLTTHKASQLNIAESGAESADMIYMAEMLIKKIKNDPRINMQKHWKLISLMIGANDFCNEICWTSSPWSILENHKVDLLQVLRILRDNLPRTFVALIPPPHLKNLVDTRKGRPSFKCFVTTDIECSCMFGLAFQRYKSMYYDIMLQWQMLEMEIADYPEFQRNDFVVVAQPILMNISIPLASDGYTDMTYLSSDCFHISQKTNARFANGLWNNLLETVGAKSTTWSELFHKFDCPTLERPYLATTLNSKQQFITTTTTAAFKTRNIGT
ncbi:PREDICTED: phospholipase B1, membrane-associated-like isoform X1 [Trachymyrmex cornetzi]|uniref:phospholipase B1, membrane-associated-like isoform X1 n=1 Tax=Trachymyrmex cornetzi TaxID=471704 RepID=UPI00084F07C5|nr:PREDICTED: phospholipase B1, membrane-associated-like isoform X1 [Trachymyrmex cornetzi]